MKRKMQQNEKKWKLRLTEALQASFWTLEVARDEKEVFPRSGKKSPRNSKKGKEENRDQLRALFSCLIRHLKYKLRPEINFSDNLEPSGHSKIQNPSTFGLDMSVGKKWPPRKNPRARRKRKKSRSTSGSIFMPNKTSKVQTKARNQFFRQFGA